MSAEWHRSAETEDAKPLAFARKNLGQRWAAVRASAGLDPARPRPELGQTLAIIGLLRGLQRATFRPSLSLILDFVRTLYGQ